MLLTHIFNDRDGGSEIHKAGCAHLKKSRDEGFSFDVETRIKAVLFVYECQIDESVEEYGGTADEVAADYIKSGSVKFAPCVTIK